MTRINISLLATLSMSIFLTSTAAAPSSLHLRTNTNPTARDLETCADTTACRVMSTAVKQCNPSGGDPTIECMCGIQQNEYTDLWDDMRYCLTCIADADPTTSFELTVNDLDDAEASCQNSNSNSGLDNSSDNDDDTNTKTNTNTGTGTNKKNSANSIKVKAGFILVPAAAMAWAGLNFVL